MIIFVAAVWVKHDDMDADLGMIVYSALLALALAVSSPVWLWRMATSGRYREGLGQRLGIIPQALRLAVQGKRVVWLHAVSVGEALAAVRLVEELGAALGDGWIIVISTTTATGQKLAQERFGAARVFYYPLDFAWIVRRYLRALKPELLILMESELWPRMLTECERATIPVAVANARISDRSFPRYMRLRWLWKSLFEKVTLFLAQSEETAVRLKAIGAPADITMAIGNLKYDAPTPTRSTVFEQIRIMVAGMGVVIAGSTLEDEECLLLDAWPRFLESVSGGDFVLIIAPRHPQRFQQVADLLHGSNFQSIRATSLNPDEPQEINHRGILLLDTLGDLAAVYDLASVAFIGGSLVPKGGHNPLEAARFGVPVVMGPSYENFREIVVEMEQEYALFVTTRDDLVLSLGLALAMGDKMGKRGLSFYQRQAGATVNTVGAVLELLK